jgi:hypothetical protein
MTKITCIHLALFINVLFLVQNSAFSHGYTRIEEPLIKTVKETILSGKQSDWSKVPGKAEGMDGLMSDIRKIFHIDMQARIDTAIQQRDFQALKRHMTNLVFLAIRKNFYLNRQEKLEPFIHSKERLQQAERYYLAVLAKNVSNYDAKNHTGLYKNIHCKFVKARHTLGSAGFLGAGAIKPKPQDFEVITKEIENLIIRTFPYFDSIE